MVSEQQCRLQAMNAWNKYDSKPHGLICRYDGQLGNNVGGIMSVKDREAVDQLVNELVNAQVKQIQELKKYAPIPEPTRGRLLWQAPRII